MRKGSGGLLTCLLLAFACWPVLAWPGSARAAKPLDLFALGAPSFTAFTTRDGLPDPVTVTVRTDRDGFAWVGTQHGLARYDGKQWHKLDDPALDGYVDQLFLDHAGTLWASSRTFGLARYGGVRWHLVGAAEGLTSRHLRRLVETDDHGGKRLWAVTWDGGLFYRAHGRWHADAGNAQLPPGVLLSFAQTRMLGGHERQWVGSGNQGLWYREGAGPWRRFQTSGFDPNDIESLFVSRHAGHEALWISVFGSGLWRLDEHGLRGWTVESGELPTNELYNIVETPTASGDYAIWVASRAGLVRVYHDQANVFDRRYGLPSNAVRGVSYWRSPDGVNVLWLATEAGLARTIVGGRAWKTVSLMGSGGVGVFGVLIDTDKQGDERLWVASMGDGLGLYEHGRWSYYTQAGGQLPSSDVRMIVGADDLQGKPALWIGTRFGYLLRVRDGPRFESIATPWPHDSSQGLNNMLSRTIDGKVEQWFATNSSGVYRLRSDGWTAYRPQGVRGQWSVKQLLAQKSGDGRDWLWASSGQGLGRFDGSRWTLLGRDAGLPDTELLGISLMTNAQGRQVLWLGSVRAGIIRIDVTDPMHPRVLAADLPAAPDPNAYSALRDSHGDIFICTNSGLQVLTPTSGGYASRTFTTHDGMVNDECNGNSQLLDAQGRFWTGTLGGLTAYDPARVKPDHQAKPLKLIQVLVDNKPVTAGRIRIPPGHHDLRVQFALLSWRQESESRFRTWLQGFDATPGPWTADNYRDIGALPAGDFLLRIEARDYAGNLSTPILLPITVMPEWWQRAWVWGLLALVAVGAIYALLRWRTRAMQGRQRVLEGKIAERTVELHEANQRLLELSHRDALTGLFNRRRLLELLEPEENPRESSVALIFADVDHFKYYNDSFGHQAGDYALRAVADAMRAGVPANAIAARYGGEEFACLLFDCSEVEARAVAERIRAAVAACPLPVPGHGGLINHVTISAGVAARVLVSNDDAQLLLRDADDALYRAKRDGRNCVRAAGSHISD